MRDRINEAMPEHLAVQDLEGQGAPVDDRRRKEILDRYAPDRRSSQADLMQEELRHISAVPGFLQYDRNRQPQDFMLWRYAPSTP